MTLRVPYRVACAVAFGCGAAVSSGLLEAMWLAALFPALPMIQDGRTSSYRVSLSYYFGASWPIVVVARNYFGSATGIPAGIFLWAVASSVLALPWLWAWSARRESAVWRTPAALCVSVLPPLGIIGWAHPLTGAGVLFPGTNWFGVLAALLLPGALVAYPRFCSAAMAVAVLVTNAVAGRPPLPPAGWTAVDTQFGDVSGSLMAEYSAVQWMRRYTRESPASVIIFPESVIPRWTRAVELSWAEAVSRDAAGGKTILLGAQIRTSGADVGRADLDAAIRTLKGDPPARHSAPRFTVKYRNVLVSLGADGVRLFDQHVPVPLAMWKPFTGNGVPMNWLPKRPVELAGQRCRPQKLRPRQNRAPVTVCNVRS